MEHIAQGQRPPSGPDEPATRGCGDCLDNGYVSHGFRSCQVSWFCDCSIGRSAEAGHWFSKVYQREGERRSHSGQGQKQLAEYLSARPEQRFWLLPAIERLRVRFENERKRKLEATDEP